MPSASATDSQREDFSYCVEGWIQDQQQQAGPEFEGYTRSPRRVMSDSLGQSWARLPERSGSPSKRQRMSEADSGSQWVERLSSRAPESALSTFTEPTSSATSASRASAPRAASPTKSIRNRRIQLNFTSPAIYFGPPKQGYEPEEESSDNSGDSGDIEPVPPAFHHQVQQLSLEPTEPTSNSDGKLDIPPDISALVRRLSEEAADPALPPDIILRINKISPTEFFREPRTDVCPSKSAEKLLRHVSRLFEMARELFAGSHDESAWYPLIREILIDPPHTTILTPFVKHEEAHTKQVCSELLPQQNGQAISTVKVDHLLQFNPSHRLISPLYNTVFRSQLPSFSLSAFNDPVAARTFTCAVVEVKPPGGNFQEASYQIAIASAAILERIRTLGGIGSHADDVPVVGWIAHGHFWTLHVSYREADGSIRILGPYPSGNTATYLGLYRLLRIIQEVKRWGMEIYFPYLSSKLAQFVGTGI